jgi:enoyl-CoA hydratase/carnithine racemase
MTNDTPFQYAIRIEDSVAYLDLNRPEEGNTLTRGMMGQLSADLKTLGARDDVNVVAITARGTHFCRGRDGRGENAAGVSAYDMRVTMMGPVHAGPEPGCRAQRRPDRRRARDNAARPGCG